MTNIFLEQIEEKDYVTPYPKKMLLGSIEIMPFENGEGLYKNIDTAIIYWYGFFWPLFSSSSASTVPTYFRKGLTPLKHPQFLFFISQILFIWYFVSL